MKEITKFDKQCLTAAIDAAKETSKNGNYPVGAVLAINNKVLGVSGNEINKEKSFVKHAELSLIIKYAKELAEIRKDKERIATLYSTLEPCIQCLGASVINHIDRILFIEKDPNGGACNLKHDNIGLWYREFWPEIKQYAISKEPKKLMIKFFKNEIKKGNTEWPAKMLELLKSDTTIP